jgi:hypothetical protein
VLVDIAVDHEAAQRPFGGLIGFPTKLESDGRQFWPAVSPPLIYGFPNYTHLSSYLIVLEAHRPVLAEQAFKLPYLDRKSDMELRNNWPNSTVFDHLSKQEWQLQQAGM